MVTFIGCASAPPPLVEIDPTVRENEIFACKQAIQTQKKKRFALMPRLLQRLAGDNQVLKQYGQLPRRRQLYGAIARFPLAGDSGGTWSTAPDAAMRTISTRFDRIRPPESASPPSDFIAMNFGQPGRIYTFPIAKLRNFNFGASYQGGLYGKSGDDTLQIRIVDEDHLLIVATTEKTKSPQTRFAIGDMYALVRTYSQQSYSEESKQQLSDYPIYDSDWNEMSCDQLIDSRK